LWLSKGRRPFLNRRPWFLVISVATSVTSRNAATSDIALGAVKYNKRDEAAAKGQTECPKEEHSRPKGLTSVYSDITIMS